ncbi:MAG: trigger factor family protein [Prevotellaceae bacterium]|jgi:trigger factor|nr:trigger factor family protein [Prevotellaceae bacterium]
MEVIQNREGLVATLTVKVSQEDYAAQVEKGLKKMRQTAQLKGFRPGNVPMPLIKKMYEQSIVFEEINKIVRESIEKYEKENEENILTQVIPSTVHQWPEFGEHKDFEFVYEAGFTPEFTYQIDENTELPYYNILVEDKNIDSSIEYYSNADFSFENTDIVEEKCFIKTSTELEDGTKVENASILISAVPDEYKSLFLGTKVNDVINVEIRKVFPNEIDLTGMLSINKEKLDLQPEILPFTIVEISRKIVKTGQELYDYVAGKDNIHSEEELREYLRKAITSHYENLSLDKLYFDSIAVLKEKANIILPKDFIAKYIRFLQKENNDDDISDDQLEELIEYFIYEKTWKYIVKSLFKQADITITYEMMREEMKTLIEENFNDYQYYDMNELVDYHIKNEHYSHTVLDNIKRKKLALLLKEKAKLNVTDLTIDEFNKLNEDKDKEEDNINENKEK